MNKNNDFNFIKTNISNIVFWIVFVSLTPLILFFIKFNINDLNSIDKFGLFGSYLSGTTSFLLMILTAISIYVLYKTFTLTRQYNEKQIEFNNNQIKISNFTLLTDLLSETIKKIKKEYLENNDNLGLTDTFTSLIYHSKENHNYMKDKDKNEYMINNYNELLSLFLEKNKITISDEFILNMMFSSKENNDFRFIMKELSPIVKIMIDIITNEDTTQDLKDILSIMLKNKVHNDIILWGIIYSSLNIEEVYNHAGTLFIIPNNIRLALKSYMESEDE